jgi:hypothetical protein
MIRVNRAGIAYPPELAERAERETQKVVAQFTGLGKQERLTFSSRIWAPHKALLADLFRNKCAYCETRVGISDAGDIDLHRPKGGVAEDADHPGYYWLAYRWENHYLTCRICNTNKRNRFPVQGIRAGSPSDNLAAELPFLIDPCADEPEEHLEFIVEGKHSGKVIARTDRGKATIATVGLNRDNLVIARREEIELCRAKLRAASGADAESWLNALQDEALPYVATRRALIRRHREESRRSASGPFVAAIEPGAGAPMEPAVAQAITEALIVDKVVSSTAEVSPRTGFVSRVQIENFKSIESVDLRFDFAREGHTGWQVFLGENGTGKSTILQALTLALIGEAGVAGLGLDTRSILRISAQPDETPTSGFVAVWLGTDAEPIRYRFDANGMQFESGTEGANVFLRAYGPTRLMPRRGPALAAAARRGGSAAEKHAVSNLFDPYTPLCDAPRWLASLTEDDFDKVALSLKDVLRIRSQDNLLLVRENGAVRAYDANGVLVDVNLLSHGQQSALVLATDIVSGMAAARAAEGLESMPKDFQQSHGIIVLDEIDAHLHPRWKMEIVPSLRRAFPHVQFIATTHEPLCLRGLHEREIVLTKRSARGSVAEVTPISPAAWRVDQLLTSELFGLHSTIDPDVDAEFQEYYLLLARRDEGLQPKELGRLEHLRVSLQRHNRLGYTRRDQLLYEVIDDYLVKELKASSDARMRLREETKRRIAEIWQRVSAVRGENA